MDTKLVQEVLRLVLVEFIEDFNVDALVLAYLSGYGCIESRKTGNLLKLNDDEKVVELFRLLGGSRDSIEILIGYFKQKQTSQSHLMDLLKNTREQVLRDNEKREKLAQAELLQSNR